MYRRSRARARCVVAASTVLCQLDGCGPKCRVVCWRGKGGDNRAWHRSVLLQILPVRLQPPRRFAWCGWPCAGGRAWWAWWARVRAPPSPPPSPTQSPHPPSCPCRRCLGRCRWTRSTWCSTTTARACGRMWWSWRSRTRRACRACCSSWATGPRATSLAPLPRCACAMHACTRVRACMCACMRAFVRACVCRVWGCVCARHMSAASQACCSSWAVGVREASWAALRRCACSAS